MLSVLDLIIKKRSRFIECPTWTSDQWTFFWDSCITGRYVALGVNVRRNSHCDYSWMSVANFDFGRVCSSRQNDGAVDTVAKSARQQHYVKYMQAGIVRIPAELVIVQRTCEPGNNREVVVLMIVQRWREMERLQPTRKPVRRIITEDLLHTRENSCLCYLRYAM